MQVANGSQLTLLGKQTIELIHLKTKQTITALIYLSPDITFDCILGRDLLNNYDISINRDHVLVNGHYISFDEPKLTIHNQKHDLKPGVNMLSITSHHPVSYTHLRAHET